MEKNMNVTFSVQTDFDDIPKEIAHLLRSVQYELGLVSHSTSNLEKTIIVEQADQESFLEHGNTELRSLHAIRLHLAKIDTRLEDCMAILSGYVDHIENPQAPEKEESVQEGSDEEG
jgi:hypothetical protein